jgi:site-specific recombinase XerD
VPKWVPNPELVERLLAQPDEHTYGGMRDQVVFGLAVTVGLTTAELASLTLDSLDLANHRLKVRHSWRTRDGEERWVPIEPPVEKAFKRYLAYARPALARGAEMAALFLNKDGKPASSEMVTGIFTTHCERLGVKRLNCKALRNVAALYQLRHRGRTIEDLMEIFGYRTIKHVRGYMAYLPKELRKQVDRPRYPSLMQDMDFEKVDPADQFARLEKLFVETEAPEGVE